MKCGLLGRKLGHSYSPRIHRLLGKYEYHLFEKEPEELETFLRCGDWDGVNVTMPYKQTVIPYLDSVSSIVQKVGAVNTIIRRENQLVGLNTDYWGFYSMLYKSGLSPAGKKCLVLGNGGASKVVQAVLQSAGGQTVVISRSGENHYQNLHLHRDAALIVNTTPVGMYPNTGFSPVDLNQFPHLEGVLDIIYNPARTQLLMDAEKRGIVAENGLWMLISQAVLAAKHFTDRSDDVKPIEVIYRILKPETENIVLIGMPGCGKSTIGQLLSEKTGKTFVDADAEIIKIAQKTIPRIFAEDGEEVFRSLETQVLAELGKQSGLVIATGGGCVTRGRNYPLLHQNGTIFWLRRELDRLPTEGRPLSIAGNIEEMYQARQTLYSQFADHAIENNGTAEDAVNAILEVLQ